MASTYVNFVGNFWINLYSLYHIFQNHIKSGIKLGVADMKRYQLKYMCVMTMSEVSKISK
jgi:NOL1/NOP2/fmu family ribosome biogenesis protein